MTDVGLTSDIVEVPVWCRLVCASGAAAVAACHQALVLVPRPIGYYYRHRFALIRKNALADVTELRSVTEPRTGFEQEYGGTNIYVGQQHCLSSKRQTARRSAVYCRR
jgi:hypothetical protein